MAIVWTKVMRNFNPSARVTFQNQINSY